MSDVNLFVAINSASAVVLISCSPKFKSEIGATILVAAIYLVFITVDSVRPTTQAILTEKGSNLNIF